jgi:hypothetical protein
MADNGAVRKAWKFWKPEVTGADWERSETSGRTAGVRAGVASPGMLSEGAELAEAFENARAR